MITDTGPTADASPTKLNWQLEHAEPGVLVYSVPGANPPTHPLVRRTVDRADRRWVPSGTPTARDHPAKHSPLHRAEYIGRVGVLAAALGVGAAIAGTPGVASATPAEADSTTSSSSTAESADVSSDEAGPGRTSTSEPSTGTTSADAEDADAEDAEDEADAEDTTADAEVLDAPTPLDDTTSETVEQPSPAPRQTTAPSTAAESPAGPTADSFTETVPLIPVMPEDQSATTAAEPAPPISPETEPPAPVGVVKRVLNTVLAPLAATESPPTQTVQTPLLWGAFEWVRHPFANSTPVLSYDPTTTLQHGNIITGHLMANQFDSDTLTLTASAPVNGGTVAMHPDGTFSYTVPVTRYAAGGTDTFTTTATDARSPALAALLSRASFGLIGNRGHTATTTVTLDIAPVTASAYALGAVRHGTGAVPGTLHVTASNSSTYALTGGPTKGHLTLDTVTGAFVYTPTSVARHEASAENATADELTDTFTITVDDGQGGVIRVPVSVAIDPSNSSPTMTMVVSDPDGAGTVHVIVTVTDPDNDPTTYLVVHDPAYGTLTPTPDGYDYNPNAAAVSPGVETETVTVTASDLHHGTDTETATVTISPANIFVPVGTAAVVPSSTGINLPAAATVFTLRGRSYGRLTPDRMSKGLSGIFAQDPYSIVKLDYPTWGLNSIKEGVKILDAALMSTSGDIIVAGHSEGAQVASRWIRQYASDPVRADLATRLTFVLTGNPLRSGSGKAIGLRESDGVIGQPTPTTTPWPIIDVARRWDGWADWPTDTTSEWAVANAMAGQNTSHMFYSQVDLYDPQNTVWQEGNTTFVLTHENNLPMLTRYWFAPSDFESVVRAKVEAGYDRPSNDIPVPVQPIQSLKWQRVLERLVLKFGA